MLKAAEEKEGRRGGKKRRGGGRRTEEDAAILIFFVKLRCWGGGVPAPALLRLFFSTRCSYYHKWYSTESNNGWGTQTHPSSCISSMNLENFAGGCVSCCKTAGLKATSASSSLTRYDRLQEFMPIFWLLSHPNAFFLLSKASFLLHGFLCSPSLLLLTAAEAWSAYGASTFLRPVIYAVRCFTAFGWPAIHVGVQSIVSECQNIPCLCSAFDCACLLMDCWRRQLTSRTNPPVFF